MSLFEPKGGQKSGFVPIFCKSQKLRRGFGFVPRVETEVKMMKNH